MKRSNQFSSSFLSSAKLLSQAHALRTGGVSLPFAGDCLVSVTPDPRTLSEVGAQETAQQSQHRLLEGKQESDQHRAGYLLQGINSAQQALMSVLQDFVTLDLPHGGRVKNGELESSLRRMSVNQELLTLATRGVVHVYHKQRAESESVESGLKGVSESGKEGNRGD